MVQKILGAALAAVLVGSLAASATAHPAMPADSHVKERTGALTGNSYGAESCSLTLTPAAPVAIGDAEDEDDFVARTVTAWGITRTTRDTAVPARDTQAKADALTYGDAVAVYNISLGDKPVEPERLPNPGDDADQAAQTAYAEDQDAYTNREGKYGAYDEDIANWNIAVSAPAIVKWRKDCANAGYKLHDERETVAVCPEGERYSQQASGGELTSRCTEIISVSNAPENREIRAGYVVGDGTSNNRFRARTAGERGTYYRCDTNYGGPGYTGVIGRRCTASANGVIDRQLDPSFAMRVWESGILIPQS